MKKDSQKRCPRRKRKLSVFLGALKIPGVVEFSLCLFSAKLVSYIFLWLPHYIKEETDAEAEFVSNLANKFEYGSMVGGIVAGFISDQTEGLNALICTVMLIPLMYFYNLLISNTCPLVITDYGFESGACYTTNVILLLCLGMLINGPFSLITTAVSAELGQHQSLKGSGKALATVTAIIDGTGSIGMRS
jgi:OPA family glycerol-3-phosphate transporter-like MFS transporter 1/2